MKCIRVEAWQKSEKILSCIMSRNTNQSRSHSLQIRAYGLNLNAHNRRKCAEYITKRKAEEMKSGENKCKKRTRTVENIHTHVSGLTLPLALVAICYEHCRAAII